MLPIFKDNFGNPSSTHFFGRNAKALIETSRRTIAKILNCQSSEIIFMSGGTEADNMALHASVFELGVKRIITTNIEHHAVGHTVESLAHYGHTEMKLVNIDKKGNVDLNHLDEILKDGIPTLVSLMHANNEIATLLPLKKVSGICRKYGAYFHSDTVQTMGHYMFDLQDLDIDFITCAAHKFHGPKGIGFLYVNKKTKVGSFIHGGSQERGLRGGTENIYGIVGLAKALELSCANYHQYSKSISDVKNYMIERLKEIDGITFNGDYHNQSLYTVLNVSFPPSPISEMLLFKLDIEGISASGGSACSSGSNVGSHVLAALNLDARRANVRFSFDKNSSKDEVDFVLDKLKQMYALEIVANG
jgi:cysteine desulfurase